MEINYDPTETAELFHNDDSFVRLLFGPVGCGKSVANCIEVFRRAWEQEPGDDGIRRSRWGIIRNTYPELKSTTIKTWLEWFPEEVFGKIKWDSPITHRIRLPNFDLEVVFLALDSEQDIKKLMSFEFTGIYINELQYVHEKIFKTCRKRIGRYPAKKSGAKITWKGVIADTNPPSTRHWIYKTFEEKKPKNYRLFRFAPGVIAANDETLNSATSLDGTIYINNPHADYINNIPNNNYYIDDIPGSTDEEIKVFMQGEYGIIISGKPVHPEYKDRLHYVDKALNANPDVEIGLGWDFGLTPACAITQFTPTGQLIVLAELYDEAKGLHEFAESIVLPFLDRHYPFWKQNYISKHDPAGQAGSQTDMKTCQKILRDLGINSLPASSNAATARREGLKYHLRRLTGGEPGFLLSNKCPQLREGLMGHYQYGRIQSNDGAETRYHEKPLKNMHSHICEGLEYIAMHYARNQEKKPNPHDETIKRIATQFQRTERLRRQSYG